MVAREQLDRSATKPIATTVADVADVKTARVLVDVRGGREVESGQWDVLVVAVAECLCVEVVLCRSSLGRFGPAQLADFGLCRTVVSWDVSTDLRSCGLTAAAVPETDRWRDRASSCDLH